ncbi:MAG: co-chaperone GroES [FCB group bacterium]|nr:co-chaperone GroES [FCB group bacterium]
MKSRKKQIIVVGDRLLVRPDKGGKKSSGGLYLPPSVTEKQEVRGGVVVEVGPGIPVGNPDDNEEPWSKTEQNLRYIPLQAEIGDYTLFLNKAAIPITVEGIDYVIVPQSAILILIRDDMDALTI